MSPITIIKSDIDNVLKFITPLLPSHPIIVEAGAFNGQGTLTLSNHWPQGTIHAFEPVPELFQQLTTAIQDQSNVYCYPMALGTTEGSSLFYISEKKKYPGQPSQAGSILRPKERLQWSNLHYPTTFSVSTITLDRWAQDNNIEKIDFFWLDVQGYALPVLQAARDILQSVRVLYTELEFIEAYENQHRYEEVKTWLESQGFIAIAQDFTEQQSWFFGNVVFLNKSYSKE